MKILGFLLVLVAIIAIDHGGGITWGLIAILIVGILMLFPNFLPYFFENWNDKRE